jgi:hypothetical protein
MKITSSLLIALGFHALVGAVPISPVTSERDVEAAGYTGAGGKSLKKSRQMFIFRINLADSSITGALILNYDIVEEKNKRDAKTEADKEAAGYTGAGGKFPYYINYNGEFFLT